MARNLKGYRKIVVEIDEKHTHIDVVSSTKLHHLSHKNFFKDIFCENHYHDKNKNFEIVDFIITPSFVEYVIRNINIEEFNDEEIAKYLVYKAQKERSRKLKRILG